MVGAPSYSSPDKSPHNSSIVHRLNSPPHTTREKKHTRALTLHTLTLKQTHLRTHTQTLETRKEGDAVIRGHMSLFISRRPLT